MLFLGLSGGIGSGKSTVSTRLAQLGAVVIDADQLARDVVSPGTPGLAAIASRFGDEVLLPDGSLNRPALGAIVFADDAARRELEAITHPAIRELTAQRHTAAPAEAVVVHDMPLLVEAGLAPSYHLTLIVAASEDRRLERLVRDRGMDPAAARARIAAQATDEQRYAVADVVLDNNGSRQALLEQVEALWRERLSPYNDNLLADRAVHRPARVTLANPDPQWPSRAARSISRLDRQLSNASLAEQVSGIDHIGSTSVPGLAAKDVIDLQLQVHDLAIVDDPAFAAALTAAGFGGGHRREDTVHPWAPDPTAWTKQLYYGFDPAVVAHLHVREAGSPGADVALLFRDWLRANPAEREAYAAEKARLAVLHPGGTERSRGDYSAAKEPWVAAALARARKWRRAEGQGTSR